MTAWLMDHGLKLLLHLCLALMAAGAAWATIQYRVSEANRIGQEAKDGVQELRNLREQDQRDINQTLKDMNRSLGRIEGALGTK